MKISQLTMIFIAFSLVFIKIQIRSNRELYETQEWRRNVEQFAPFKTYIRSGNQDTVLDIKFHCDNDRDIPVTFARNKEGKIENIFYWNKEVLSTSNNLSSLCHYSAEHMNIYASKGYDMSSIHLIANNELGLPAVCLAQKDDICDTSVFIWLSSSSLIQDIKPTLMKIIAPEIVTNIVPCEECKKPFEGAFRIKLKLFQ